MDFLKTCIEQKRWLWETKKHVLISEWHFVIFSLSFLVFHNNIQSAAWFGMKRVGICVSCPTCRTILQLSGWHSVHIITSVTVPWVLFPSVKESVLHDWCFWVYICHCHSVTVTEEVRNDSKNSVCQRHQYLNNYLLLISVHLWLWFGYS